MHVGGWVHDFAEAVLRPHGGKRRSGARAKRYDRPETQRGGGVMQKGLGIVAAFCLVTMGLILLQPKRSPDPGLQLPALRVEAAAEAPEATADSDMADVTAPAEDASQAVIASAPEPAPEPGAGSELAPLATALRPVLRPQGLAPVEAPITEERLAAPAVPEAVPTENEVPENLAAENLPADNLPAENLVADDLVAEDVIAEDVIAEVAPSPSPDAAEAIPVAAEPELAAVAPVLDAAPLSAPDAPAPQERASARLSEAPLVEVPSLARTALAALPVSAASQEPAPQEPAEEPILAAAPLEPAPLEPSPVEDATPEADLAEVDPEQESERAITQVIAGLLRGALSSEETEVSEDPGEDVVTDATALPPNAALFADMAAERPRLIIATGTDADGRIGPSLRSMAHNTKIYPSETANRPDSLLSLDINSDRSVAEAVVTASPVAVARSYSSGTITLTTRMANSPATLPVAGPLVPTVEASAEFATQGALDDIPLMLDGPSDAVATLAAPEEVGNVDLRARLADAPTRAVHTVRLGDSLLTLALRYYGDPEKAEVILEANRRHLNEDGSLLLGQIVRIPDIDNL